MDHSEGKQEQVSRLNEKKILENRRRLDSNHIADQRRMEHADFKKGDRTLRGSMKLNDQGNRLQKRELERSDRQRLPESTKSKDKNVPGKNYNANEVAESRKRRAHAERAGDLRFEELSRKKNLSDTEQQEWQKKLQTHLEHTDPHWREADRADKEGMQEFNENPAARIDFCHLAGVEEHKRWEKEELVKEKKMGRKEGKDFGVEAVHQHPDGKPVRLDKVDYNKDTIFDVKPLGINETEDQLIKKYEKQRQRHIEAYEQDTGRKVREYIYVTYRSSKDLE
jgi:hypothetical protein